MGVSLMLQLGMLVALAGSGTWSLAGTQHVPDIARARERPPGAPSYSDILFSSRWPRPMSDGDKHDTFENASAELARSILEEIRPAGA